jgi:hypothetical protein
LYLERPAAATWTTWRTCWRMRGDGGRQDTERSWMTYGTRRLTPAA